jgi:hypothetical protein
MSHNAKDCAKRYLEKGLSVIAVAPNGTKAPAREVGSWTKFQHERPQFAQLESWYPEGSLNGVAILGGAVSGKLTILDFDSAEAYIQWREDCAQEGLLFELDKLPIVQTPSGGRHVYCWGISAKCAKLAKNAGGKTLIETKAEGGYCLAPGCPPECHPLGLQYHWENEGWMAEGKQPEPIDPEIYDLFVSLARLQDEKSSLPDYKEHAIDTVIPPYNDGRLRPGDDYNQRSSWEDILLPLGWTISRRRENVIHWRRPDKKDFGISATSGYCRGEKSGDRLFVFSSNAWPFQEGQSYSKFSAYALVHCGNDLRSASKRLSELGYGTPEEIANLINMPNALPSYRQQQAIVIDAVATKKQNGIERYLKGEDEESDDDFAITFDKLKPPLSPDEWYWFGFLCPGQKTLITALPKIGKTTLMAALLKAFEQGDTFIGYKVQQAKVLYASEEHPNSWSSRIARFELIGHYHALVQAKVKNAYCLESWKQWLGRARRYMERNGHKILVIDTLSRYWPVADENDAVQATQAIDALDILTEQSDLCVMVIHHQRKSGGTNFTGARGSGAIVGRFDIILDFDKVEGGFGVDKKNQRILKGSGRWQETPAELVIELNGNDYELLGDCKEVKQIEDLDSIHEALSNHEWKTLEQIRQGCGLRTEKVTKELKKLIAGGEVQVDRTKGTRGNPQKFKKVSMELGQKDLLSGGQDHVIEGY